MADGVIVLHWWYRNRADAVTIVTRRSEEDH
jgi:hypothetical protein